MRYSETVGGMRTGRAKREERKLFPGFATNLKRTRIASAGFSCAKSSVCPSLLTLFRVFCVFRNLVRRESDFVVAGANVRVHKLPTMKPGG